MLTLDNPVQYGFRHTEGDVRISQPRCLMSRLLGIAETRPPEDSWDGVELPGTACVCLSLLVMQSLVRQENKKLILWSGGRAISRALFFMNRRHKVLLIYLNSIHCEQMSQLPLCAFGKYGWEMEWSRPNQCWLAHSLEDLIFFTPNM